MQVPLFLEQLAQKRRNRPTEADVRRAAEDYVYGQHWHATLVGKAFDMSESMSKEEFVDFLVKHMKGVLDRMPA